VPTSGARLGPLALQRKVKPDGSKVLAHSRIATLDRSIGALLPTGDSDSATGGRSAVIAAAQMYGERQRERQRRASPLLPSTRRKQQSEARFPAGHRSRPHHFGGSTPGDQSGVVSLEVEVIASLATSGHHPLPTLYVASCGLEG
jgi:hypothetical protein